MVAHSYFSVAKFLWHSVCYSLLIFIFPYNGICQNDFVPIPAETVLKYHFNFERNFYEDPAAEQYDLDNYRATLKQLELLQSTMSKSSDRLLKACQLYDAALVRYMRLTTYFYLRTVVDTQDSKSRLVLSELDSEFTSRTAFVRQELMRINKGTLKRFLKQSPKLSNYVFAIESARRFSPHTLSIDEEEILGVTSLLATDWQNELFGNILGRTAFGKIATSHRELDVLRERTAINSSPDRAVRGRGFRKLYEGYFSNRDLYAFALTGLAKARNRIARLRHFKDASSEVFFQSYWTRGEVEALLKRIEKVSDVYRRYQRLRSDSVRSKFGYTDVNIWDIAAGSNQENVPRFTIGEATALIHEAINPLGWEYSDELESLLDPANGRIDVAPGPNRRSANFSKGFPGVTTVFFSSGFRGYYNDMRVLAHESTHAVHRQLMKNNHVLPVYANGPSFLFESFAIFNELLLADHLFERESDPARSRYFLEQFFDGKGMTMFAVAQEEEIEMAIYDGVDRGEVESADDLDNLTNRIAERFSIWPKKHEELKMQWITSSLFYEDPFYDTNYVFGALLALKYFEMYKENPKDFVPRYIALMKNGFNASPNALLKGFLKIDINDPRLTTGAVRLLAKKLDVLQREYADQ